RGRGHPGPRHVPARRHAGERHDLPCLLPGREQLQPAGRPAGGGRLRAGRQPDRHRLDDPRLARDQRPRRAAAGPPGDAGPARDRGARPPAAATRACPGQRRADRPGRAADGAARLRRRRPRAALPAARHPLAGPGPARSGVRRPGAGAPARPRRRPGAGHEHPDDRVRPVRCHRAPARAAGHRGRDRPL
ncbi:MAG: Xylulose-5-phosphate phosphoketolase @ Fructose-6-phosphate phosphoketolase, partial [uncultured Friedmanniella sp.]